MKFLALLVIVGVVGHLAAAVVVQEKTKLVNHLLEDYNTDVEPENPDLHFSVAFLCARYDSEDKSLKTTALERYKWKDSRLAWTPSEYGGVETLRLSQEHLWVPDFKLFNSLSHEDKRHDSKCVVHSDGTVTLWPSVTYKSLCEKVDGNFECDYKLGPWSEDSHTLPLSKWVVPVLGHYLNSTCPLLATVTSSQLTTHTYPCCPELYGTLEVKVQYTKNPAVDQHHGHGHGHADRHEN